MSEYKRDGGPAFPRPQAETSRSRNSEQDGMSLRDAFALAALSNPVICTGSADKMVGYISIISRAETAAIQAYEIADAMLAQRNAGREG